MRSATSVLLAREIAHLKKTTTDAGRRLADLSAGEEADRAAAETVRRLKSRGPAQNGGAAALGDAEATLRRLRNAKPWTPQSTHRWNPR